MVKNIMNDDPEIETVLAVSTGPLIWQPPKSFVLSPSPPSHLPRLFTAACFVTTVSILPL